jgi:Zn-finger nucleic acid-binding protein
MNCPNCDIEMTAMELEGHQGRPVAIDLCRGCQAFWFDKYESLQLAPGSTLRLMKLIGESAAPGQHQLSKAMRCPRCSETLRPIQDMQRTTRFNYFRCDSDHGRLIRFFEFLREKDFIRPLSQQQISELRKQVQTVNCSNCGGPIDLSVGSICAHCKSPVSMLDMKQPQALLAQLREAAVPKPLDPTLPLELARAKRDVGRLFGDVETPSGWPNEMASDLVHSCLISVARWLTKSGI